MKLKTAQAIIEAAETNSFEMELREGYSGRGMFGKTTVGIVYKNLGDLLTATAEAAVELYRKDQEDNGSRFDKFIVDIPDNTDSMGLDSIIY